MDPAARNRWFTEEVHPHESSLRAYLRQVFPSLPDIDDVVQESYLRLLRAKETSRIQYAKALLFTTARNLALDFFRRRGVVRIDAIDDVEQLAPVAESPDAAEAASRQQELDFLAEAVSDLPERCRQVLTLRLLYGYSMRQIAEHLGMSSLTVKTHLARGMRRCAERLKHRGVQPAPGSSKP